MKVKQISLKRTFNLGNYENIQPEIVADVEEDEDIQESFAILDEELIDFKNSLQK